MPPPPLQSGRDHKRTPKKKTVEMIKRETDSPAPIIIIYSQFPFRLVFSVGFGWKLYFLNFVLVQPAVFFFAAVFQRARFFSEVDFVLNFTSTYSFYFLRVRFRAFETGLFFFGWPGQVVAWPLGLGQKFLRSETEAGLIKLRFLSPP